MLRLIFIVIILPFILISCKSKDTVVNSDSSSTVKNSGTLKLISPVNGNYYVGDTVNIAWQSSNIKSVNILYLNDSLNISYTIQNNIDANLKQYTWVIPASVNYPFKIKIEDADADTLYDESELITPLKHQFIFPVDVGYIWTYNYYLSTEERSSNSTNKQWGTHTWKVVSKQIYNDSTVFNVSSTIDDSVHIHQESYWIGGDTTIVTVKVDTTYKVETEKEFLIIVTKDNFIIKWDKDMLASYNQSYEVVPKTVNTKSDTLKYSFSSPGGFLNQIIYVNNIGFYHLNYTYGGMSGWVSETTDLIDYKISK